MSQASLPKTTGGCRLDDCASEPISQRATSSVTSVFAEDWQGVVKIGLQVLEASLALFNLSQGSSGVEADIAEDFSPPDGNSSRCPFPILT